MEAQEALSKFNQILRKLQERELTLLEAEIFIKFWDNVLYKDMQIVGYSEDYIKNTIGCNLLKRLSKVIGQRITKKNFRLLLEPFINEFTDNNTNIPQNQNSQRFNSLRHIDLIEAPDINRFYGRTGELEELEKYVVKDGCRLVGVYGMGGIGKTSLVVKLVEKIQDKFEFVIWKSLEYTPFFEDILNDLENRFFYPRETSSPPTQVDNRINTFINNLNQYKCLLVLDSWESIMEDNSSYSQYKDLLLRVGKGRHKSCLIFTSLKNPKEMGLLSPQEGSREFSLKGLTSKEAKDLLKDYRLTEDNQAQLIDIYRGHPFALHMTAKTIQNNQQGKIAALLLNSTLFMTDTMIDILDKQWRYLSEIEKNIMSYLSQENEFKCIEEIMKNVPSISKSDIVKAVDNLVLRGLIEKDEELVELQPLVKKYVKKRYHFNS